MSEIQHTNRAHARLNASSSHRWMMCPPSVKLSEQFEDKPSTYAEEGSYLHELCELKYSFLILLVLITMVLAGISLISGCFPFSTISI